MIASPHASIYAPVLGGPALIDLLVRDTHTCYLGERGSLRPWGYGCGQCPACTLRQAGFEQWRTTNPQA